MKYAYFPGCVALDSCRELDSATREVARELGIELVELDEAACCGAGNLQEVDPEAALAVNARTLAMAEGHGLDILTVCGTCQLYLSRTRAALENPETRDLVNARLKRVGRRYEGTVKVKHFAQVLLEDVGPRKLAAHVRRPLAGLPVGAFYGCHILRAPGATSFDDPENPSAIERLVTLMGGNPVTHAGRTACCGFHILTVREDVALRMTAASLADADAKGVAALATPCPLCHLLLDAYQGKAGRTADARFDVPVLHLSQLVGLAFGIDPNRLGLKRHLVSPKPVVRALEEAEVVQA